MDGHTAINHIRAGDAGEKMRHVWITALTADARAEQKERVLAAGANDYLLKPIRLSDLDALLRRFVAFKHSADKT
jgi:CheY-like chemotaxis protein